MNNANFSMMRYLRDLGLDAHLLMYDREAEHFHPRHDTWHWEKWSPYVHKLRISNGGIDSLLSSKGTLIAELGGYDVYVGNGIAPVLFRKMGRTLDLFIPYGEGVEFIIEHYFRWQNLKSSIGSLLRKRLMEDALKCAVRTIITANMHPHSLDTYRRLGLHPVNIPAIGLYVEPKPGNLELAPQTSAAVERMQRSSLVVLSHVSHFWKNLPAPHFMAGVGKRNNWLVQGFAEYVREADNPDALLCLFEYGGDVAATKSLIAELDIKKQVIWFPKMSRREIMCLLPYADIGGSEFAGMYWGGCGWEFLASGVPMLHQLTDPETYESASIPLPPFFNVRSTRDIRQVLLENDRESLKKMGQACKKWFDAYQGYSLAKRYVALIEQMHI
jgi:hypothetical protein